MFSISSGFHSRPVMRRTDSLPLPKERVFYFQVATRLSVAAVSRLIVAMVAMMFFANPAAAQNATPVAPDQVTSAANWLLTQQGADGGFVGFSGATEAGITVDAVLALAAANEAGADVNLQPALDYLYSGDVALVYAQTGAGQAAKLVLAVVAAGGDPRDVNGVDPLSLATADIDGATGHYGTGVFDHALVMLAIAAAGDEVPDEAISRLVNSQLKDGSWSFDGEESPGSGDTNSTAISIMALAAAGKGDGRDVQQGIDYLKTTLLPDGSFPYQPADGAAGDANSTGIVVQALVAAGQDPASPDWNNVAGRLLEFQNESGAFRYMVDMPDDNLFATVQAIPAIAGVPFPIVGALPVASPIAA